MLNTETEGRVSLITKISKPCVMALPKIRTYTKARIVNPNSIQGKLTAAIRALEIGQMIKIKYDGPDGNVSGRIGAFRNKNPDIKITTRKLDDETLGIWRIA